MVMIKNEITSEEIQATEQAEARASAEFINEMTGTFVEDIETAGEFSTDRGNFPAKNIAGDHCYAAHRNRDSSDKRLTENVADLRKLVTDNDGSEGDARKIAGKRKFCSTLKAQVRFFNSRLSAAKAAYRMTVEEDWVPWEERNKSEGGINKRATADVADAEAFLAEFD